MESDEEYTSAMSSDDEIMQDYSGDEISAGEGKKPHRPPPRRLHLLTICV